MAIFVDNKIQEDSIYVRFYHWEDHTKGWGDAGTYKYLKIPTEDFEIEERENIEGEPYYIYNLNKERGIELLGNYWWMSYGYKQSTPSEKSREIKELEQKISQLQDSNY